MYEAACVADPVFRADENQSEESQFQRLQQQIFERMKTFAQYKPLLYKEYRRVSQHQQMYPLGPTSPGDVSMDDLHTSPAYADFIKNWRPFAEPDKALAPPFRPRAASAGEVPTSRRRSVRQARITPRTPLVASPMDVDATLNRTAPGPYQKKTVVGHPKPRPLKRT